jgi:hypothetical protein
VKWVAEKRGWEMSRVALAWIMGKVTNPIRVLPQWVFNSFSQHGKSRVNVFIFLRFRLHILKKAIIPGYKLTEGEIEFLEELYVFFIQTYILVLVVEQCLSYRPLPVRLYFVS